MKKIKSENFRTVQYNRYSPNKTLEKKMILKKLTEPQIPGKQKILHHWRPKRKRDGRGGWLKVYLKK